MSDKDEVFDDYLRVLKKVQKGLDTLKSLREHSKIVHPQSVIGLGLQSSTIIVAGYLRGAVKELFHWMKLHRGLIDDWISLQDEETFSRNLEFYGILKSEEGLETLCDSVIQKGDQWVCVPSKT